MNIFKKKNCGDCNYLIFILAFNLTLINAKINDPKIHRFDTFIQSSIKKSNIAGLGISILCKDSILYKKGYGYEDIQKKEKFTTNTIMNIASISKTFVGVSIMYLVEQQKINLDDDVNTILPFTINNPHEKNPITLRSLMSHASGIIDNQDIYLKSYHYGYDSPIELEKFLQNYLSSNGNYFSKNNFNNKGPGEEFNYSNIGTGLAGLIVEIIAKKPLNVFSKEIIFTPLGMNDTYWFFSEMDTSKHSKLYKFNAKNNKLDLIELYGLTTYPDGGLRTTVNDLTKYFHYCINYKNHKVKILKQESLEGIFKSDFFDYYSKFWNIGNMIGHGGGDPGVTTGMFYNKEQDIGYIFLINTSDYIKEEKFEQTIIDFGLHLKNIRP